MFRAACTQWRIGISGATGLDYNALPFIFRMKRVSRADWQQLFEDITEMEEAALELFREKAEDTADG